MKDEIKEILEELKEKNETYKECSGNGIIENEYYKSHILLDYITNIQQENKELKKQKEELRSWLEENIICYENSQNTNLGEYERKIHFYLYNDVLGKLEELEGVSNE